MLEQQIAELNKRLDTVIKLLQAQQPVPTAQTTLPPVTQTPPAQTAVVGQAAPTPSPQATPMVTPQTVSLDLQQTQAALGQVAQKLGSGDQIQGLITSYPNAQLPGQTATRLSDIDPVNYPALVSQAQALVA